MKVFVRDGFPRGGLPDDVELPGWDAPGEGVEFALPERRVDARRLDQLPDVRVVQVLSAGVDWVEDHVPEGVTLCNAGDTRSPAVAQWVVAVIHADLIGFRPAEAQRAARSWEHWRPRELAGRRVVIVGYGSIGRAVERRLEPFGVRTPHNSGDTPEAELAAQALARAQMLRYRAGLPLQHVVSGPALPPR